MCPDIVKVAFSIFTVPKLNYCVLIVFIYSLYGALLISLQWQKRRHETYQTCTWWQDTNPQGTL